MYVRHTSQNQQWTNWKQGRPYFKYSHQQGISPEKSIDSHTDGRRYALQEQLQKTFQELDQNPKQYQ